MSNPLYTRNADRTGDEQYWRGMTPEAEAKREAAAKAQAEQHKAEVAAYVSAFDAEWTREVTIARKEEWNRRVKSGEFNGRNGKIDMHKPNAAQDAQGWTYNNLVPAVKQHGL